MLAGTYTYCTPGPSLRALPAFVSSAEPPYEIESRCGNGDAERGNNLPEVMKLIAKLAFAVATNSLNVSETLSNTMFNFYPKVYRLTKLCWGWGQAFFKCPPSGPRLKIVFAPAMLDGGSAGGLRAGMWSCLPTICQSRSHGLAQHHLCWES